MFNVYVINKIVETIVENGRFQEKVNEHFENSGLIAEYVLVKDEEIKCIEKEIYLQNELVIAVDLYSISNYIEDTESYNKIKENILSKINPEYSEIETMIKEASIVLNNEQGFLVDYKVDQYKNIFESFIVGSDILFAFGDVEIGKTFEEAFPEIEFNYNIKINYKDNVDYYDMVNYITNKLIKSGELEEF